MASRHVQKANDLFEGQTLLYAQIFGYLKTVCLKWAVQLGIPDIIKNHGESITLPELLSKLKVPPSKTSCVPRLMRFLAHNRIFDIHVNQKGHLSYSLTPASELLVSSSDHCLSPVVTMFTNQVLMGVNHHLGEWVCGEVPTLFEVALGTSFWELVKDKPSYMNLFNEGMASDSKMVDLALKNYSSIFEGIDSIVDVGGGTGTTAKIMSAKFSNLKCIVFDLPHVVANLLGSDNLSYVGGDMFISIPQADAVLLKVHIYI